MALDDYLEPEVAVAVAVTAAVASPPVRRVLRQGAVYGLAGLMMAGDKLATLARGAAQGAQNLASSAGNAAHTAGNQAATSSTAPVTG